MLTGILAGLTTCALWGLTFVAPRVVEPFSAWDLTVARYGIFGIASVLLMLHPRFRPTGIAPPRMAVGLLLGGAGYVGYFVSAAYAVRLSGAAIPPLIIGTMPVLLAIIANWREKTVPWRSVAIPLAMISAGVLIVNVEALTTTSVEDRDNIALGALAAVAALAIWIAYGLANAVVMRQSNAPDGLRWTGVQGIGAAIGSALLLPLTSFGNASTPGDVGTFVAVALVMGLAGSWLATWCWVVASRRLPLAFAAQLIVAETVFGLAYGFAFEARWPTSAELIGCALQILGVLAGVAAFAGPEAPRKSSVSEASVAQRIG